MYCQVAQEVELVLQEDAVDGSRGHFRDWTSWIVYQMLFCVLLFVVHCIFKSSAAQLRQGAAKALILQSGKL